MKCKSIIFFFTLQICFIFSNVAFSLTQVNGDVSGHWDIDGHPYVANGDINLLANDSLIIDPGVEVRFGSGTLFNVSGTLIAIGTEEDSISFRANTGRIGDWRWLRFIGGRASNSMLSYCKIQHAERGIHCDRSSPSISHCRITDNSRYCVLIEGSSVNIQYSWIGDCEDGVLIDENSSNVRIRHCEFSRCESNAIVVTGSSRAIIDGNTFSAIHDITVYFSSAGPCSLKYCEILNSDLSAVNVFQSHNIIIHRNVIKGSGGSYAVSLNNSNSPIIVNNTIKDNRYTGLALVSSNGGRVINNIISSNSQNGLFVQRSDLTLDYNDIWGNTRNNYEGIEAGRTDISEDPRLDGNDTPLQGSPVINAGWGFYRDPDGTIADIGAKFYNLNHAPVINYYSPENLNLVHINQEVEFIVSATDEDGQLLTYTWSVNGQDRATGIDTTFRYQFTESGNFNVKVLVNDRLYLGTTEHVWEFPVNVNDNPLTPDEFRIVNPFPNPFNATTQFGLNLQRREFFSIDLYDIMGAKLSEIQSGNLESGSHLFTINAFNEPAGVYFIKISGQERQYFRKILLLK